ncbi:hypothetical protein AB28_3030, partial [Raoultella ornithinolytica 2-156-04_S1_C2]
MTLNNPLRRVFCYRATMSTYKTKNPLGSAAVKDLYDNAENVDKFVNDRTKEELDDRLGVLRKTWYGMEMIFSRFITYITGRGEQAVASIGWQELGNWAAGLTVDNRQQIVYYNGSWYKYLGELEHVIAGDSPENDGGVWSAENPTGKWSNIGDAALRSNLVSGEEGMGAAMINGGKPKRPVLNLASGRTVEDMLFSGEARMKLHFGAYGDGIHDDTLAFEKWFECLTDSSYDRNTVQPGEPGFMLQKGPLLTLESGLYVYSGTGLSIGGLDSYVLNIRGESALSTKIMIVDSNGFFIDSENNP